MRLIRRMISLKIADLPHFQYSNYIIMSKQKFANVDVSCYRLIHRMISLKRIILVVKMALLGVLQLTVCESVSELVSQLGSWFNEADPQDDQPKKG